MTFPARSVPKIPKARKILEKRGLLQFEQFLAGIRLNTRKVEELQKQGERKLEEDSIGPGCILFDGRTNLTKVLRENKKTGKVHGTSVRMKHTNVTSEPSALYSCLSSFFLFSCHSLSL